MFINKKTGKPFAIHRNLCNFGQIKKCYGEKI